MKNLLFVFLIISIAFLCSCKKNEESTNDVISHQEINKTITNGQIDSVGTRFGYILFEINETQDGENLVIIKSPYFDYDMVGVGSVYCITVYNFFRKNVRILERDFVISEDKKWTLPTNGLSLKSFAGEGKNIIGLKYENSSNGPGHDVFFGWIEIEVSENMDELTIYSFASNRTPYNSIKAGQTE